MKEIVKRRLHIPHILLLIETSRAYGRQLVKGIGRYAHEHGPWSFHFEERGVHELSVPQLDWRQIDGVISRVRDPVVARRLRATKLPLVELHGNSAAREIDITIDESVLAFMAADHLMSRGLACFGFFAQRNDWWLQSRRQAFVAEIQRRKHFCDIFQPPRPRLPKDGTPASFPSGILQWLKSLPNPCGILCATDLDAQLLLEICRQSELGVPDQIAVLGVDNDSVICSVTWPPLSSIDLDAQRVGYEAAALLARLMAGRSKPRKPLLIAPSRVAVRASTDVLAITDPIVVQAARFIRLFACKGINVGHVADHLVLSRRTLERRFRASLNRTLNEEILRVKIDHAKMLLTQNNYPTKRISNLSGFGSLHYFARAFSRITGETPGRYRLRTRHSMGPFIQ